MRIHRMIQDHETEDKVIGGKLTLRKFTYVSVAFCYTSYMFLFNLSFSPLILVIKIVTSLILVIACLLLGFLKVDIYYLDYYLIKKWRYLRNRHIAVYRKY